MLLANMAKSDSIERVLTLKRDVPLGLSSSKIAIDQLMDCFVKGAEGSWNPNADFDYLAYLFADLAKVRKLLPSVLFSLLRCSLLTTCKKGLLVCYRFISQVVPRMFDHSVPPP